MRIPRGNQHSARMAQQQSEVFERPTALLPPLFPAPCTVQVEAARAAVATAAADAAREAVEAAFAELRPALLKAVAQLLGATPNDRERAVVVDLAAPGRQTDTGSSLLSVPTSRPRARGSSAASDGRPSSECWPPTLSQDPGGPPAAISASLSCVYACILMHLCMYVCLDVCMCVCAYVCIYILCLHVRM